MDRISSPIGQLQARYDVVVIGSGYGGGISASRLARAGKKVCVLERGLERLPGEYPDTFFEVCEAFRVDTPDFSVGADTALVNYQVGPNMDVVYGSGLGGSSLINAGAAIRPDPRVFDDARWPAALRGANSQPLYALMDEVERMLGSTAYPENFPTPAKLTALQNAATALKQNFVRPNINVTFKDGPNAAGVEQKACILCGDCVSGCNHFAKNTVLMNYLPDAHAHGAELFVEVSVDHVAPDGNGGWTVFIDYLGADANPPAQVSAEVVILAAGTLGSSAILLRSQKCGLPLSGMLGQHFSGNGDMLGYAYNGNAPINEVGLGTNPPNPQVPIGPCITGLIDLRNESDLEMASVVEDASLPGGIGGTLPGMFAAASLVLGKNTAPGDLLQQQYRQAVSLLRGPYHGAVNDTQMYLNIGHDDANGKIVLQNNGRINILYPEASANPSFPSRTQEMVDLTAQARGVYVENPMWSKWCGQRTLTAHPLGGCVMADSAAAGVVNDRGQVFCGASGSAIHDGLYVSDGSVIPLALGVNPLLTISAITERMCGLMIQERKWSVPVTTSAVADTVAVAARAAAGPPALQLRFSEYINAEYLNRPFSIELFFVSPDLNQLMADSAHNLRVFGSVSAPALGPAPLAIAGGDCDLFVDDAAKPGTRHARYRLPLDAGGGRRLFLAGTKTVDDDADADAWRDASSIHFALHDGPNDQSPVLGHFTARIAPDQFQRQMSGLDITGAPDANTRLAAAVQFGRWFAGGGLYDRFGAGFWRPDALDGAPARKRRVLRAPAPNLFNLAAADGAPLRLTRYRAGDRGPVLLSHGLALSSHIFNTDTIDSNLVEYLVANKLDIWLFDYRSSTDFAAPADDSADAVARLDYPAAVAEIRRVTGAPTVDVIAHGYGAATFCMALLAGLRDVRAAVCLLAGTHFAQIPVAAQYQPNSNGADALLAAYSSLYQAANLNSATNTSVAEYFGATSAASVAQLDTMIQAGHVVDAAGADTYLPHLNRLALPIRFISAAHDPVFPPAGIATTVAALARANGAALYSTRALDGYGHLDCVIGADAAADVYPIIVEALQ